MHSLAAGSALFLHQSFFAPLNGSLSEWDTRYAADHSLCQGPGALPLSQNMPMVKADFNVI